MLISIDFTLFLHIVPISLCYSLNFLFLYFLFFFISFAPIRRKLTLFFIPLTPNLASSWKVINYSKALLQCRCTFVYELRQCLSYWNLFSSSKRGKLREYSKQFILWCKLISLPSDPKLIYHAAWNGDILRWSGWAIYVYNVAENHRKHTRCEIRFPLRTFSISSCFLSLFYCWKQICDSKTRLNKLLNYFDKFIDYYLIKIHFGVIPFY